MGDDVRRARRDRTKSPHNRYEDCESIVSETGTRRTSLANFSASKLVENLKETSIENLVKKTNATEAPPPPKARAEAPPSTRRVPGRTRSAQGPNRPAQRRMKASEHDVLSQSMDDGDSCHELDDASAMSGSLPGRRRAPARTKSQDSGLTMRIGQRPRAGRRPGADREDSTQDMSVSSDGRRRAPARSKSYDGGMPVRGPMRPSRPNRRRPQGGEEEDVVISDSDEEDRDVDIDIDIDIDVDDGGADRSGRRRREARRPSADGASRSQRTARVARRRPSLDASPARRAGGPGLQRSLTGNPPSSNSGHGLSRSQTTTNSRGGARVRGGRDTARELAQFANRERSPEEYYNDDGSGRHYSNSPIKSRSERRRVREGLRDNSARTQEFEEEEVVPEKKEAPWMKRLKKKVGEGSGESVTGTADDGFATSNHSNGDGFFPVDPSFGVFAATSNTTPFGNDDSDDYDDDDDDDGDGTKRLAIGGSKLDFSSIAN